MLAINDYLNKAKEGVAGLAKNFTDIMLQANNQAFSNLVGGFQQSNNDLKMINQAIMQKGINGLSPDERQMFEAYYMNPVMGMVDAPKEVPSKAVQILSGPAMKLVNRVKNAIDKSKGISLDDALNIQKEYEVIVPFRSGQAAKTGKLPSLEAMVNELDSYNPRFNIKKIELPKGENPVKFLKDKEGLFAGSKPTQPKGVGR